MSPDLSETPTAKAIARLPEVLSVEQAAWLLQTTPRVLNDQAKLGVIPARKIGQRRVYSKSALLAYVSSSS